MTIIKCLVNKFKFAFEGLFYGIKNDRSIQIQYGFAIVAIIIGLALHISKEDWIIIIMAIGMVIITEYLNSAIESLSDHVCQETNDAIKIVKDLAAGAVLVAALVALVLGIIVYSKYIF